MSKIIVAIGGNALGNTPEEQKEIVKKTAKNLVDMIKAGHQLVIVHGNGPQVGMINNSFDVGHRVNDKVPFVDFPECGSMSQGYIGFHLQNAIKNELISQKIKKTVASVVTQTVVDVNDKGFTNPTKPIGDFMDEKTAKEMASLKNWVVKEDAGRGWRRVIASPRPADILEKDLIISMIENNFVPIAVGGGGIPVILKNNAYEGVAAVIDKDFAAAKIAEITNADKLIILTAVEKVMINYNKPDQKALDKVSISEINKYIKEKQFAEGSMLPKIQAAMSFIENGGKESIIGSLDESAGVINGTSGTIITK